MEFNMNDTENNAASPRFIKRISGVVFTTGAAVDIELDGKSLVVVGRNGSGKTSFLQSLNKIIGYNIEEDGCLKLDEYRENIRRTNAALQDEGSYSASQVESFRSSLRYYQDLVNKNINPLTVEYAHPKLFSEHFKSGLGLIRYYEAIRRAAINQVKSATPVRPMVDDSNRHANLGANLEQHLVNIEVGIGLAMRRKDEERIRQSEQWLSSFNDDLKYLFEDDSIEAIFDADKLSFTLRQDGRPPYTFQSLSSGYLAIFDIYADLVMRTEYRGALQKDLLGVVLIDEIDAHLHVSLQRKILPFLMASFPNIQFIVTTHSPFVASSAEKCIVYDISTGKNCEDLTMFSVEHVVEGLLGVPVISTRLEDVVSRLSAVDFDQGTSLNEVEKMLSLLSPHLSTLDDESRLFYEIARERYLRYKGGANV